MKFRHILRGRPTGCIQKFKKFNKTDFNLNYIAYLSKYCMIMCVLGWDPLAVRWLYCRPLSTKNIFISQTFRNIHLFASYEIFWDKFVHCNSPSCREKNCYSSLKCLLIRKILIQTYVNYNFLPVFITFLYVKIWQKICKRGAYKILPEFRISQAKVSAKTLQRKFYKIFIRLNFGKSFVRKV